jgi:ABC-type transport system involved in Fe-S cluster assembly fused permease/ATPase subunit
MIEYATFTKHMELLDGLHDELGDSIEAAQLTKLINNLPNGIDSPIGDRGLMLSGGERQRVAFARAILRGSPIIIIDEGTSALDETTERKIIEALRPIPADRIVVMVAHRKAVIASADDICIVNGGKMSFVTPHAQIIK